MVREAEALVLDGEQIERGHFDWLRNTPYWAISAALHVVAVLVMINIVWRVEVAKPALERTIIQVRDRPVAVVEPYDPTKERKLIRKPEVPGPETEKLPVRITKDPLEIPFDIPKGVSFENFTDFQSEQVEISKDLNDALGTGAGAAARFGDRRGKGTLIDGGGSRASESAVLAALEWLLRHQSADGSWKSRDFTETCKQICANQNASYGDGRGWDGYDVGVTGLAVLAFAGYGHTHLAGERPEFVQAVRRAVSYLKSIQVKSDDPTSNGRYGADRAATGDQWIYNHAIATMAMAELLVMTNDRFGLTKSVTDATNFCLNAQNAGSGWKYGIRAGVSDSSVTGWMVLALKTAKCCQLDIPGERFDAAFKGALTCFDRATSAQTGRVGYESPGDPGSALNGVHPEPYPYSKELSCMTAVGVLCRIFSGESRTTSAVKRGVEILMKETPQWQEQHGNRRSKINLYYWYYATYAMFQVGGDKWTKWNKDMQCALLDTQRRAGDEDGSWDPIDEWGPAGGRVYATAIGAMTLEVYYRFERETGLK